MTKCYRCESSERDKTESVTRAHFSNTYTLPSPNMCRPFESRKYLLSVRLDLLTPPVIYDETSHFLQKHAILRLQFTGEVQLETN